MTTIPSDTVPTVESSSTFEDQVSMLRSRIVSAIQERKEWTTEVVTSAPT